MSDRGKLAPPCPDCQEHDSFVVDSRFHLLTLTKRRTRQCRACGQRFITEERALRLKKPTTSSKNLQPPTRHHNI